MEFIGDKLRVPSKTDTKAWTALERTVRERAAFSVMVDQTRAVHAERVKRVQAEIAMLSAKPGSEARTKRIIELEQELKQLVR